MEYLIGRAAQDAQAEGLEILSLSGAPLTRSAPADGGASSPFDPLLNLLASVLEPAYGFGSLHAYKRKFKPRACRCTWRFPTWWTCPRWGSPSPGPTFPVSSPPRRRASPMC